jgi:hypothetical protein
MVTAFCDDSPPSLNNLTDVSAVITASIIRASWLSTQKIFIFTLSTRVDLKSDLYVTQRVSRLNDIRHCTIEFHEILMRSK